MSKRVTSVRNIKTIKAYRGEALTINLGKEYAGGTLTAWMKKSPNASTYREFSIGLTNSTIELSKEKTSDYYNSSGVLIEAIEGRWYFDVEFVADGASSETVETVVSGTILFINDITNSNGYEIADPQTGLVTDSLRIQISEEQNLDSYLLNGLFRFGDTIPNISSLTFTKANGISSNLEQLISGTSIAEILIEIRRYETIGDDFVMVTQHMTTNTQNQVYTRSYSGDANVWSDWALLTNVGSAVSNTSDLVNDGSDGTSTYVENDELGSAATSNNYNDLDNKPTAITKTSDLTNDGADGTSTFVESDELSSVATSGDYDDLTNKPTIPTQSVAESYYRPITFLLNSGSNLFNGAQRQHQPWNATKPFSENPSYLYHHWMITNASGVDLMIQFDEQVTVSEFIYASFDNFTSNETIKTAELYAITDQSYFETADYFTFDITGLTKVFDNTASGTDAEFPQAVSKDPLRIFSNPNLTHELQTPVDCYGFIFKAISNYAGTTRMGLHKLLFK